MLRTACRTLYCIGYEGGDRSWKDVTDCPGLAVAGSASCSFVSDGSLEAPAPEAEFFGFDGIREIGGKPAPQIVDDACQDLRPRVGRLDQRIRPTDTC